MIRNNRQNEIPFFGQSFRSNLFPAFVDPPPLILFAPSIVPASFMQIVPFFFFISFFVQLSTTKEDQEEIARDPLKGRGGQRYTARSTPLSRHPDNNSFPVIRV